jgi:hypothetical protein
MLTGFTTTFAQNCFVNPRIKKITASISPAIQSYLEFKPIGYDANPTKRYPLLIYIGGTGEMFQQPGGTDQDLCPAIQYSMPWRMNVGHFPDVVKDNEGREYSYLVVMPFVTKWEQQYNIDPGAVIDYMLAHYRIDTGRIYLTAMSRGTDNIMGYVTGSSNSAKRIAAVVPVANCFPANVGTSTYATQVSNLASENVHVWGISCTGDIPCTETYIKNWTKSLDDLKPGYGVFTYATYACDTVGPNASHHYAWNSAYDPDYRFGPGNKNVYEWMIQFTKGSSGPPPPSPPPPVQPDCNKITFTPTTNSIKIKGLIAPVITVQIFNSSWASVYNQYFNNSPDSINVPSLSTGTYHVTINFYTSAWATICSKTQDVVVGTTTPPPPPPPPGGTPDCNGVKVTGANKNIKVEGLVAPVVSIQIFNNSWATIFNQTYTNSPGTVTTANLPNGIYHVKVAFNTASWSPICNVIKDATVGPTASAAPSEGAVETNIERTIESTGRVITVAPNPFSNVVEVTINSTKTETGSISIVDISGREVARRSITLQMGRNQFSVGDLGRYNPGNYILRLVTKDGVQNLRLIKQ